MFDWFLMRLTMVATLRDDLLPIVNGAERFERNPATLQAARGADAC